MSETPRTDEKEFKLYDESLSRPCSVVRSSFARQLETELEQTRRALKKILKIKRTIDMNLFDIEEIHSIAQAALSAIESEATDGK